MVSAPMSTLCREPAASWLCVSAQGNPRGMSVKGALAADEAGVSVVGSRDARRGGVEMAAAIIRASSGGGCPLFPDWPPGSTPPHTKPPSPRAASRSGCSAPASTARIWQRIAQCTTGLPPRARLVSQFPRDCPPGRAHVFGSPTRYGERGVGIGGRRSRRTLRLARARPVGDGAGPPADPRRAGGRLNAGGHELHCRPGVYVAERVSEVPSFVDEVLTDVDVRAERGQPLVPDFCVTSSASRGHLSSATAPGVDRFQLYWLPSGISALPVWLMCWRR